ncbi:cytochrome-c peroxidase [Puia dinghuensis]|uniref:Cytochrome-c peroxidase n=1 Tax=Puia dinghuensis TaxID=1792502 RepID=A0A8J2UBK7_9BACT|nr:cytochrome c peroxidase [Puia dinghuensis]GGA94422.1 cytochrome-c peroxidase [Puia dinghuensis]
MKKKPLITGIIFTTLAWITTGIPLKPTPMTLPIPAGWPAPKYDTRQNPLTVEGFVLGRKLFYDQRLSRDSTLSCASCHQQFGAFATFDHPLSHGIGNTLTTRNAPALQNLAWQEAYMWDGGINHLDLQPLAPLTAPNEMGETLADVLHRLQHDTSYQRLFKAAFGDTAITTQRFTKALSQYLIRLISADSKYDRVMQGKDTFLLPERLGYAIFQQKCSSCHREPLFTDGSYRNIGMPPDNTLNDYGRMRITGKKEDSLKFRVPSLRNVAITHPYGHDGRFFSLLNVFEHYRKSGMIPLSNFEIGQLTAFLNTLTDTSFLKNPLFAPPGYTITPVFIHRH